MVEFASYFWPVLWAIIGGAAVVTPALSWVIATVPSPRLGETLRSMLLNAFGWWKVSQITYIVSLITFRLGGLGVLAGLAGFFRGRRAAPEALAFTPSTDRPLHHAA